MAGVIGVTPYRLGEVTPCERCDFPQRVPV